VLFSTLHPAAPAATPHTSVTAWLVFALVLGVVIASGLVLSSRR
jgi:hypothetical protein